MNAKLALAILTLGLQATALADEDDYTNIVRQHDQNTGVFWDIQNVAPNGSSQSKEKLDVGGALFQLWTIDNETGRDYLLDQKVVGVYLPKAQIVVNTLDPFAEYPRTRADQPFSVDITVSDLISSLGGLLNLPLAATSVLAEHHLAPYPPGVISLPIASILSGNPLASGFITKNGTTKLNFEHSTLQPAPGEKPFGEEHFVVHSLTDGSIGQTQLASGFVQVWPVATGTLEGIQDGQKIGFNPPRLSVSLVDLYPGSYSYIRVRNETTGAVTALEQSQFVLDEKPTDTEKLMTVSDYGNELPDEGPYTFELVTETPFGTDVLATRRVFVDRVLEVRAQLGGLD